MFSTTFAGMSLVVACWFPFCRPAPKHCPAPVVVYPIAPETAHPTPPPAKKEMPPSAKEKSLYERLGGEPAVKAVIDDFVGRAAGNPKVNFTRKGTPVEWKATPENVEHLKKGLVDLVGMVTGGPQKYSGRSMKDVHKGMMITQDEFNALASDLKATLDKFKVPAKEQAELMKIVGGTAGDIVEAPKKK